MEQFEEFLKKFTGKEREQVTKFLEDLTTYGVRFGEAIRRANEEFNGTGIKVRDISNSIQGILTDLESQGRLAREGTKSFRKLESIVTKIQDDQLGIYELSLKEIRATKAKTQSELKRLELIGQKIEQKQKERKKLTSQEKEILGSYKEQLENQKAIVTILEAREKQESNIARTTGLTGAALKNLNKLGVRALGGLGINIGALDELFEQASTKAEDLAKSFEDTENESYESYKNMSDFEKQTLILKEVLPDIGKGLKKVLTDPLAISLLFIVKIAQAFGEVNKASVEAQRLTGQNSVLQASLNDRLITSVEYLKTISSLTEQIGINANNAFSGDVIAGAAEIQKLMGLTAEQAGTLAILTQTTSKDFDSVKNTLVDSVSAFNRSNRAAVSQAVVLRDVASTSEDILVSFNNQPGALARAAASARKLGLDLAKIDEVANSLLDFESSISNELQAQLITGKTINLEKAREFALANDLEGLSNELFKNSASIAEFSSMNRIQQEAQAQALGLSRQELAKIALQQSINLGISNKALEAAAGVTAEDLERLSVQEQLKTAIDKIATALVGPAELFASIADNTLVINTIMTALAATTMRRLYVGVAALTSELIAAGGASALIGVGLRGLVGLAALGTAAVVIPSILRQVTKVDDGIIGPDGGLVVSGPKGSYQLNSGDSVVAGTNLGGTPSWARELISAFREGRDVYMDGNKVSQQLAIGSFKSA